MKLFAKKVPQPKKHELREVAHLPRYHEGYRPVKCIDCGKQFLMEPFGGWAVEWNFTVTEGPLTRIEPDSLEAALQHYRKVGSSGWFVIDYHECESDGIPLWVVSIGRFFLSETNGEYRLVRDQKEATRYRMDEVKKVASETRGFAIRVEVIPVEKDGDNG